MTLPIKDEITLFSMYAGRVSVHSKILAGKILETISLNKAILKDAEMLANKIYEGECVNQNDIENILVRLKEIHIFVSKSKTINHNQNVLLESLSSMIAAFS